jgi:hypothetical protein
MPFRWLRACVTWRKPPMVGERAEGRLCAALILPSEDRIVPTALLNISISERACVAHAIIRTPQAETSVQGALAYDSGGSASRVTGIRKECEKHPSAMLSIARFVYLLRISAKGKQPTLARLLLL